MYNTGKPHKALGKLTPNMYKSMADRNDSFLIQNPLSTVNRIKKRGLIINKKVNVI